MTEKSAKPEKKRKIWREHALYFPLAAVLVAAFIVAALVSVSFCEAVKCESALTVVSYTLVAYLVFCVCAIYMAHCFQLGGSEDERQKIINSALSFVALFLVIVGAVDAYTTNYYIGGEQLALEAWVGGILAIWGLLLLARRTANQDKQLAIQVNKEIDDRFIAAVTLLGNSETSARAGAVYSLYHLAIESEKYRKQIAQVLCSHIRSKTQEKEYQAEHKDRPSNEIQTAIDILFKDINGVKGLYCHGFAQEIKFPRANLSFAHLCGADFTKAQCQGADFSYAQCWRARFIKSKCQRARFYEAQCQEANFRFAKCQGSYFVGAKLQGADFYAATLHGSNFDLTQCQGAYFHSAYCYGISFERAGLQGANFHVARCQGGYFAGAQCQGADFASAKCQFADFSNSQCQDANFYCAQCQNADMENVTFEGELSPECVNAIESANLYCSKDWNKKMQGIIGGNKGEPLSQGRMPESFSHHTGNFEHNEESRKIYEEIKRWRDDSLILFPPPRN